MAICKTKVFARWSRKNRVTDAMLLRAVEEIQGGLYEADLGGGGLFKKRVARTGQGKRGGTRVLLATNLGGRWVFVYGFAKNERANIAPDEEEALKKLAAHYLKMTAAQMAAAEAAGELLEVKDDGQSEVKDS